MDKARGKAGPVSDDVVAIAKIDGAAIHINLMGVGARAFSVHVIKSLPLI